MRPLSRSLVCAVIAMAVLCAGPLANSRAAPARSTLDGAALPAIEGCSSLPGWAADWSPTFVDPDYTIAGSYQCGGYRLHVSVVEYVEQHQGKEAVGEFNSVIPRAWWNATVRQRQFVGTDVPVDEYQIDRVNGRLRIWNWYAVGGRPTASQFEVKVFEALNALRFNAVSTANLTVAIETESNPHSEAIEADARMVWTWFAERQRT